MKTNVLNVECRAPRAAARVRAFTLIEILVVITLMTVIILGLMAMFNQVQRAFRAGMTQVDVLESGRMAMNMIMRELQEVTPGYRNSVNFYATIPANDALPQPLPAMDLAHPEWRTNVLEQMFFLTRENQRWIGVGYFVNTAYEGVGSLYRFQTNAPISLDPGVLVNAFINEVNKAYQVPPRIDRVSRIVDGVVQFRVRTFDTNGVWIVENMGSARGTNIFAAPVPQDPAFTGSAPGEIGYYSFTSNAVPACVELELGILEQRTFERYKSIPLSAAAPPTPRSDFLQQQGGRVHLFRQRVAIRNVDFSAYPAVIP
jgi:hypothetical protein